MGSASSKAASAAPKVAAAAGRRQYPSSPSILNSATSTSQSPSGQNQQTQAPPTPPVPSSGSQVHPDPRTSPPSDTKSAHIDLDGRDPQFASSLRKLGPAVPVDRSNPKTQTFPTSTQPPIGQQGQNIFPPPLPPASSSSSLSTTSNASLNVVQARDRIAQQYTEEIEDMGRASFKGRTLITAKEISDIMRMNAIQGKSHGEIEKLLRLRPGVVRDLIGIRGVVDNV